MNVHQRFPLPLWSQISADPRRISREDQIPLFPWDDFAVSIEALALTARTKRPTQLEVIPTDDLPRQASPFQRVNYA